MNKIIACMAVCLLVGPALAHGAEKAWYVGASAGTAKSEYSSNNAIIDFGYEPTPVVDDSDSAWKVYGGYRFNSALGAEAGFIELGDTLITGRVSGLPSADKLSANGFSVAFTATWSVSSAFSVIGKAGIGVIKGEYTCVQLCGAISTESKTTATPLLGAAVQLDATKNFGIRADFDYIGTQYGALREGYFYKVLTAGAVLRF